MLTMMKNKLTVLIALMLFSLGLSAQTNRPEMGVSADYDVLGSTTLSFRAGGERIYGTLGVGFNRHLPKEETMVWKAGIGAHIGHGAFFNTNIELKAAYFSTFNGIDTQQYSLSLLPGLKLTDRWELFFGPDIGYAQTSLINNKVLLDKGLTLWEDKNSSRLKHLYIGFQVGLYYRF